MKVTANAESSAGTKDEAIRRLRNSLGGAWFGWETVGDIRVYTATGAWWASVEVKKELRD